MFCCVLHPKVVVDFLPFQLSAFLFGFLLDFVLISLVPNTCSPGTTKASVRIPGYSGHIPAAQQNAPKLTGEQPAINHKDNLVQTLYAFARAAAL